MSLLLNIGNEKQEMRNNRNIHEGAKRGMCLQYWNLDQELMNDRLFKEAFAVCEGRSIVGLPKLMNIYLIMKYYLYKIPSGNIIEFGSYKCGSAMFMAYLAQRLFPGMKVYALDSFEGMPATNPEIDQHTEGNFNDIDLDEIYRRRDELGLSNLEIVKGYFEDTAVNALNDAEKISLAHIDCDIYSAIKYSYDLTKPYLVEGGYIVFDDATEASCPGATEAVEDLLIKRDNLNSEQISPHYVFRAFFNK